MMLLSEIRIESAGQPYSKRFILSGRVIGLALQLSNDNWIAADENGERLSKEQFHTPEKVRRWFRSRIAQESAQ